MGIDGLMLFLISPYEVPHACRRLSQHPTHIEVFVVFV